MAKFGSEQTVALIAANGLLISVRISVTMGLPIFGLVRRMLTHGDGRRRSLCIKNLRTD